jgi:hypothetical protein
LGLGAWGSGLGTGVVLYCTVLYCIVLFSIVCCIYLVVPHLARADQSWGDTVDADPVLREIFHGSLAHACNWGLGFRVSDVGFGISGF